MVANSAIPKHRPNRKERKQNRKREHRKQLRHDERMRQRTQKATTAIPKTPYPAIAGTCQQVQDSDDVTECRPAILACPPMRQIGLGSLPPSEWKWVKGFTRLGEPILRKKYKKALHKKSSVNGCPCNKPICLRAKSYAHLLLGYEPPPDPDIALAHPHCIPAGIPLEPGPVPVQILCPPKPSPQLKQTNLNLIKCDMPSTIRPCNVPTSTTDDKGRKIWEQGGRVSDSDFFHHMAHHPQSPPRPSPPPMAASPKTPFEELSLIRQQHQMQPIEQSQLDSPRLALQTHLRRLLTAVSLRGQIRQHRKTVCTNLQTACLQYQTRALFRNYQRIRSRMKRILLKPLLK